MSVVSRMSMAFGTWPRATSAASAATLPMQAAASALVTLAVTARPNAVVRNVSLTMASFCTSAYWVTRVA